MQTPRERKLAIDVLITQFDLQCLNENFDFKHHFLVLGLSCKPWPFAFVIYIYIDRSPARRPRAPAREHGSKILITNCVSVISILSRLQKRFSRTLQATGQCDSFLGSIDDHVLLTPSRSWLLLSLSSRTP
jgi:hypothetical protein